MRLIWEFIRCWEVRSWSYADTAFIRTKPSTEIKGMALGIGFSALCSRDAAAEPTGTNSPGGNLGLAEDRKPGWLESCIYGVMKNQCAELCWHCVRLAIVAGLGIAADYLRVCGRFGDRRSCASGARGIQGFVLIGDKPIVLIAFLRY